MTLAQLPSLNASLNALSALFLILGFIFIRRKNIPVHRTFMGLALLSSTLFLSSYLYYHYHVGSVRYQGVGLIRKVYFLILISHTILAVVIVPMILTTLAYAWKGRFDRHRALARWTWPLWMYVSVTGVLIYSMLY